MGRFKIVLSYLLNEDYNFGIYVSDRVNEILENTELNEWNYLSSESNIADKTSRYQTLKELSLEKSWFSGTTFLLNNDFNIENKNENLSVNNITSQNQTFKNSHSIGKLIRHLAWIIELLNRHLAWIIEQLKNWLNWKRGHSNKEDFNNLKFKDIQHSRALSFYLAQHKSYMKEVF